MSRAHRFPTSAEVPFPPVEPPPARAIFPDPSALGASDLVAVSSAVDPSLCLAAYRKGIFPWPVSRTLVPWVSPDPRVIFPLDREPEWNRTLRKTARRGTFVVTFDAAFDRVIRACGEGRKGGTWITPNVFETYTSLHRMGWAHSVEAWNAETGALAGGLYGLAIGGVFAGESMFHQETDASKIAFMALVHRLRERGFRLLDGQVPTPHLESLGCVRMGRRDFLGTLRDALAVQARFSDSPEGA